ncbi:MAG: hypothetical protein HUJ53_07095 [Holdemanella sp.]|nr:hypothetical protein [Holdemanella sp.]
MKIAYCMLYTGNNFDEVAKTIDYLISKGDHVFVMINDDDTRDNIFLSFADDAELHISNRQQIALPADLSLPRGQLYQIMDAQSYSDEAEFEFDYFITLTDGMLPIVSKEAMDAFLTSLNGKDVYYVKSDTNTDKELKSRVEEYSFFTNSYDFQKSKLIRAMNTATAKVCKPFKKRKIENDDTVYLTYPWFIISNASAKLLAENMYYCSTNFKMCLYPEELAIGTMLKKYVPDNHINKNVWVAGKNGDYTFCAPVEEVTMDTIQKYPDALFAAKLIASEKEDEKTLYDELVTRYNPDNDYELVNPENNK